MNRKKHCVSCEEASDLFYRGDDYLEIFDDAHSNEEDRFIAIGLLRMAARHLRMIRENLKSAA
jgi:uncharacterized DUF497 family protein